MCYISYRNKQQNKHIMLDPQKIAEENRKFFNSVPEAPKTKKLNTGCYYTKVDSVIYEVSTHELMEGWVLVEKDKPETAEMYRTKKQAVEAII